MVGNREFTLELSKVGSHGKPGNVLLINPRFHSLLPHKSGISGNSQPDSSLQFHLFPKSQVSSSRRSLERGKSNPGIVQGLELSRYGMRGFLEDFLPKPLRNSGILRAVPISQRFPRFPSIFQLLTSCSWWSARSPGPRQSWRR